MSDLRCIDFSFGVPEQDLAFDEVLLNGAEAGDGGETLRFWESPSPFVVLGVSQSVANEIHEDTCLTDGVPVRRRSSAGGCVLQGPGCLNFAIILDMEARCELRTIRGSYQHLLARVLTAFKERGAVLSHAGTSDLVWNGRKVSGNAQKRRKQFLLHHGTMLYAAALESMARYLREPFDRPDYRGRRGHSDFVANLPLGRAEIVSGLRAAFGASGEEGAITDEERRSVDALVQDKYGDRNWTHRK